MGMRRRWLPLLMAIMAIMAIVGACSADPDPVEPPFAEPVVGEGSRTTLLPPLPTDPPAIEGPAIGEMALPCGRGGEASRAVIRDEIGIDADAITIGVGNDRGGLYSAGSGRGMPDAVEVMAGHCNELGGLVGREVRVVEYDAAVVEIESRTLAQCQEVTAVVGQGYLLADDAAAGREACGLPSFDGWLDDLTIGMPVVLVGFLHAVSSEAAAERVVLVGPDTTSGIDANEARAAALHASTVPASVVASLTYPIDAAPDWEAIAESIRDVDGGLVRIDGPCTSVITPLLRAFLDDEMPPLVMSGPSAYDHACIAEADATGAPTSRLLVELPFRPIEDGDAAPITARYVEILDEVAVEPTGDALLAASAFWRFATAADACGLGLGRECLVEHASTLAGWTSGGLHRTLGSGAFSDTCAVIVGVEGGRFERRVPTTPGVYDCDPSLSGMTLGDPDN